MWDENGVPHWTRGDFRGVLGSGNQLTPTPRDHCRFAPPPQRRGFSEERVSDYLTTTEYSDAILTVPRKP